MRLFTLTVSSAGRRVEIACRLKGLDFERSIVDLAAEKRAADSAYRRRNPQLKAPSFEDDGLALTQSLAILEYLEEAYPEPPLLPADSRGRARVRALSLTVACEIHALQNSAVAQHLTREFGVGEAAGRAWQCHWIAEGLAAIEARFAGDGVAGPFAHGRQPTFADCCLAPQVWNALRYGLALEAWPKVAQVYAACLELPAFAEVLTAPAA